MHASACQCMRPWDRCVCLRVVFDSESCGCRFSAEVSVHTRRVKLCSIYTVPGWVVAHFGSSPRRSASGAQPLQQNIRSSQSLRPMHEQAHQSATLQCGTARSAHRQNISPASSGPRRICMPTNATHPAAQQHSYIRHHGRDFYALCAVTMFLTIT